ncbi:hypothetical protein EXIGLDRAFT_835513 [Exidia glandulosa HHB12029]|uniref:Uncharacterized protein n=1 Tax=Exidia glandulosa HHB12029 TaxID=1314781 RepID=A0A165IPE7_EXIGL|nr:hypothetical protein EXIGLDRAFT_835513 [Exidia glandulosa HHB12029]
MYRRVASVGRVAATVSRAPSARRSYATGGPKDDDVDKPRSRRVISTDLAGFGDKPAAATPKESPKPQTAAPTPAPTTKAAASAPSPIQTANKQMGAKPANKHTPAAPPPKPAAKAVPKEAAKPSPKEAAAPLAKEATKAAPKQPTKASGKDRLIPWTPNAATAKPSPQPASPPVKTAPPAATKVDSSSSKTPKASSSNVVTSIPSPKAASPPTKTAPPPAAKADSTAPKTTKQAAKNEKAETAPPKAQKPTAKSSSAPVNASSSPKPTTPYKMADPPVQTSPAPSAAAAKAVQALEAAQTASTASPGLSIKADPAAKPQPDAEQSPSPSQAAPAAENEVDVRLEGSEEDPTEYEYESAPPQVFEYDGETVEVEDIQLAPQYSVPLDEMDQQMVQMQKMMENDPFGPILELAHGAATDRVRKDVANAGWSQAATHLQPALVRKLALKMFAKRGAKPPPELSSLSGFLKNTGAKHAPRYPDGRYRPKRTIDTAGGQLRYAQVREPDNPRRLPPAVVAAVAMPAKRVKLQYRGELEQDQFGWLRMHRTRRMWRHEVAGGDYTRFSAHVPVSPELDPESADGKTQLALRSAFLTLQKNATVTFKKKREAGELYRTLVGRRPGFPVVEDRNPTVNFDKTVDIVLGKDDLPQMMTEITRLQPRTIAPPSQ